jgi:hypothetical protein
MPCHHCDYLIAAKLLTLVAVLVGLSDAGLARGVVPSILNSLRVAMTTPSIRPLKFKLRSVVGRRTLEIWELDYSEFGVPVLGAVNQGA